jgi:phage-related protein
MVVEIFSIVKNQESILPMYFKHYNSVFSNPIFNIHNNGSTDDSMKLCKEQGCNIIEVSYSEGLNDEALKWQVDYETSLQYTKQLKDYGGFLKNQHGYLNDRKHNPNADWILMCDPDELVQITSEDLNKEDVDIIRFTGYHMEYDPPNDFFKSTYGYKDTYWNKPILFKNGIKMNFTMGAHYSAPVKEHGGEIKYNKGKYPLLHYSRKGVYAEKLKPMDSYKTKLTPITQTCNDS